MSRRRPDADAGTDSFLDVLANLVGILVILVVVTALRAAAPKAAPPEPAAVAAPAPPPRVPLIAPKPNVIYETAPPPPAADDLIAAADAAARRVEAFRSRLNSATARSAALTTDRERVRAAGTTLKQEIAAAERAHLLAEAEAGDAAAALDDARADRSRWELALAEAGEAPRPTAALEHTLLPVGRIVTGRELHFRLLGGGSEGTTVRPVPIADLTEKLETDIRAHRDRLLLRGEYDGVVGPVAGYEMRYRVEAESSVMNRVRGGAGSSTRFALAGWTLHSVDAAPAEPLAAALTDGSEFRFALATAGADSTATFWVAPEAFAAFRTLRSEARSAGLTVAARPLPADVPISGSPRGTRSVAQ